MHTLEESQGPPVSPMDRGNTPSWPHGRTSCGGAHSHDAIVDGELLEQRTAYGGVSNPAVALAVPDGTTTRPDKALTEQRDENVAYGGVSNPAILTEPEHDLTSKSQPGRIKT